MHEMVYNLPPQTTNDKNYQTDDQQDDDEQNDHKQNQAWRKTQWNKRLNETATFVHETLLQPLQTPVKNSFFNSPK